MMTSAPQTHTLGYWATKAIQQHLEKVMKHESEVLKDKDPEELHQMRVGMRRLRSAVTGFAPVLNIPETAGDKKIGKVARRLGVLRDLDVLLDYLQNRYYQNLPGKEQHTLDEALMQLIKQRQKAFRLVEKTLESKHYKQLKQHLQEWIDAPQFTSIEKLPIQEVLPDLLLPQVSELFLHPGWQVGWVEPQSESTSKSKKKPGKTSEYLSSEAVENVLKNEGESLHDLRKQAKRVRYQMNLFTNFYGSTYAAYLDDIKAVQECLGDIQDSVVLADQLAEVLDAHIEKEMPTLADQLTESRYKAWKKWSLLQRRYLNAEIRQGFRYELLHPLEKPNLED